MNYRTATWLATSMFALALTGCPGGDGDDDGDGEPQPLDVGLDARPANATCLAGPAPVVAAAIDVVPAFSNLTFADPVGLYQAPGDDSRWFVLEQDGIVRVFDNDPAVPAADVYIDLSARVTYDPGGNDERGLLGMAFHPDFQSNGEVFLSYTWNDPADNPDQGLQSYLSRFTAAAPGDGSLPAAPRDDLIVLRQRSSNHNGGGIAFGPDGFLYIGFGDEGGSNDTHGNAQDIDTLHGAMLRIDVDNLPAGQAYGIPADNPFAASNGCGDAGCREIYAWGLRNPWRWSFDRATGELWLGDVGQNEWEEVDRIERGGNYGWPEREGAHCNQGGGCQSAGFIDPVTEYDRARGVTVTGGYVYRGAAIPELQGRFLFADHAFGTIWAVAFDDRGNALPIDELALRDTGLSISTFGESNAGELYVVDRDGSDGRIHAIVAGNGTMTLNPPAPRLSETGCVRPSAPSQPAAGLIPYDLNASFWSDGAVKERWMALPDSATIDIQSDGDWVFPPGSVLVKHFRLNGTLIETRLLKRHDDGAWAGYTYEWNDAGTDAFLVTGGKTRSVQGQDWRYPGGGQCLQCHTESAGRSLGPETAQMNRAFTYPNGRRAWQLSTLEAIGVFSTPPGGDETDHPMLTDPDDGAAALDARARSYLHVNCSQCHRPGGTAPVNIDFRHATAAADMRICDVAPTRGDLGLDQARRLAPGEPARSEMLARLVRRDANAMPPLASNLVDSVGAALIEQWIAAGGGCP